MSETYADAVMTKKHKILLTLVLAAWVVAIGLVCVDSVNYSARGIDSETTDETTTDLNETQPSTQEASQEESTAQAETQSETVASSEAETATSSSADILKKSMVVNMLNSALGVIEKDQESFLINETKYISPEISHCSQPSIFDALNSTVKGYACNKEQSYRFEGGISTNENGEAVSVFDILPPFRKSVGLLVDDVSYASAKEEGEGTVLTFSIAEETVALGEEPLLHEAVIGDLGLERLDPTPVEIVSCQVIYERATLTAQLDADGNLVAMKCVSPLEIVCSGTLGKAFEAVIKVEIEYDWSIVK